MRFEPRMGGARVWAGLAALLLGVAAVAADKSFDLATGELMTLRWNDAWVESRPPPDAPRGSVSFTTRDATRMSVSIVPMPANPMFGGDTGNLRILTRHIARALEDHPAHVDHEQQPIEGAQVRGFYVKGIDPHPKPGEYEFIFTGALYVSGKPYVFEVAWNAGAEASAQAGIAAIRTLRVTQATR